MYSIYTLKDPLTNDIKYIGITSRSLNSRLNEHISTSKKYKHKTASWIKSLLRKNLKPVIELLEEVNDSNWKNAEIYWISQFKAWGFDLKNHSLGGEGNFGLRHSEESKKKISIAHKGRVVWNKGLENCFSEEWKLKRSLETRGKKHKPRTDNQKENYKKSAIENRGVQVRLIDTINNKTCLFNSITDCAKYLNTRDSSIRTFWKRGTKLYKKQYKIIKNI